MDFARDENAALVLVDNGSLRPEPTLQLRGLAAKLGVRLGSGVEPVSLLHSNRIPAGKLGGVAAELFESAIVRLCQSGRSRIVVVPLFFGPSLAVTDYMPERLRRLRAQFPELNAVIARPLVDVAQPSDTRVAQILSDHVRESWKNESNGGAGSVVVVDHGSPVRAVTEVRDHLVRQLGGILGKEVSAVYAASMERRPGPEYAFNEPLLATLLARLAREKAGTAQTVTLAMLFLSPGRHAGAEGDVAQIARNAEAAHPGLRVIGTRLVGEHPLLLNVLEDRAREALAGLGPA